MPNPNDAEGPVAEAARRLDQALAALEARLAGAPRRATASAARVAGDGQIDLIEALEAAEQREEALEAAAREASQALGRAVREVRAAIAEETPEEAHA